MIMLLVLIDLNQEVKYVSFICSLYFDVSGWGDLSSIADIDIRVTGTLRPNLGSKGTFYLEKQLLLLLLLSAPGIKSDEPQPIVVP